MERDNLPPVLAIEHSGIKGRAHLQLFGKDGKIKQDYWTDNTITSGRDDALERIFETSPTSTAFSFIAIGIGVAAPSVDNTALGTEKGTRITATVTGDANNDTSEQLVSTFGANNPTTNEAITESGVFNAGSAGDMVARQTFSAINKTTADTLVVTWIFSIS